MTTQISELIKTWRAMGPAKWAQGPYGWIREDGKPIQLTAWQHAVLDAWFDNRETCTTLAISNVKKTGKTLVNAVLLAWRWLALPGLHFAVGNDLDQSASRQFAMIADMVKRHAYLSQVCKVNARELRFEPAASSLTALAVDAAGNAGANHLTASHTECWGILYESGVRAFEELTSPPGRFWGLPSLRICDSYAGYEGESKTWHSMVDRGLQGTQIHPDWPIYQAGGLVLFHMAGEEARARCFRGSLEEAESYYTEQAAVLRPNAFTRMHGNTRTSGESRFLPEGAWEACASREVAPLALAEDARKMILGADASTTRDITALVGVWPNTALKTADVIYTRTWKPQKSELRNGKPTIELEEGIGQAVLDLHAAGKVLAVVCDPFQLHTLVIKWQRAGIKVIELAQNAGRVESDQALYDAVISHRLRHYNEPTLTQHVRNAVAVETPRGVRIAKEKTSLKIDACVALSMAHWGALDKSQPAPLPDAQPVQVSRWDSFEDTSRGGDPFFVEGPRRRFDPSWKRAFNRENY